jgi:small subunit ribosomal protein S18
MPRNKQNRTKKKEHCYFKIHNIKYIDYKDVDLLRKFISSFGKIVSRKRSGVSQIYQRELAMAIKRARFMGLLPYVQK